LEIASLVQSSKFRFLVHGVKNFTIGKADVAPRGSEKNSKFLERPTQNIETIQMAYELTVLRGEK